MVKWGQESGPKQANHLPGNQSGKEKKSKEEKAGF